MAPLLNESGNNSINSEFSRQVYTWDIYFETTILAVIAIAGCTGNIMVMKTTFKVETNFARQIMTLFFSIAVTDISICLFRVGILLYILFHPIWDNGDTACTLWWMSMTLIGIAIWQSLLVGFQRLFIVKSFPVFRKYCTIQLMVVLVLAVCISQGLVHVFAFYGFKLHLQYDDLHAICTIKDNNEFGIVFYRVAVLGVFCILPLVVAITSHMSIVHRIIKAGLIRTQKTEDRDNFIKITKTALIRSCVLFSCSMPFLLSSIIDPDHNLISRNIYRYFDYLICAHAALSPFITLQDADFGDAVPKRKIKRNKRQNSMTMFNSSFRRIGVSVITSENLKSNKTHE